MIAKIICFGLDRDEAIRRMKRAIEECVIEGVHTTLQFHRAVLEDPRFVAAEISTRFLEEFSWEPVA